MTPTKGLLASVALVALTACEVPVDFDLRDLTGGFGTAKSVQDLPPRPAPDDRGVISYPNYQVVIAQKDDTIRAIGGRLNINVNELARFNGIEPDIKLRRDELVALPSRVSEPSPATGAAQTGPIQPTPVNVTELASTAIDRSDTGASAAPSPQTTPQQPIAGVEPVRHRVVRGETVYSVSRLYNVRVKAIAEWNGLGPELGVREGQMLLVPQAGQKAPTTVTAPETTPAPGAGTQTPVPPSASAPLPDETPSVPVPAADVPKAPDLGAQTTAPAPQTNANAQFVMPVQGTIIRDYTAGKNEGIDIGAPAGTSVKAAGSGTVAAVTTNTSGVAIVVIKHSEFLTVYTNLDSLTVKKGDSVSKGQTIGKVRAGDPSFLHFEVRRGLQSVDPNDYLP